MNKAKAVEILKQVWGYESFRPLQEDIVNSVIDGKDVFAILPTGGGKSLCYQVPALVMEGVCIVVTPLVALMKDQVSSLKKRGIKAVSISSANSRREIDIILDNCVYGDVKFLYLSPERLGTSLFVERFKKMNISFIAVDEAHCVSEWGHDFRPLYLEIQQLKEYKSELQFVALTATATKKVQEEVAASLGLREGFMFVEGSFSRDNVSLSAFEVEAKEQKLLEILSKVSGTSIVYANTRKEVKSVANFLMKNGVSAAYYHGGLTHIERDSYQHKWLNNEVRVMVATNAFGMGIDKPDVRLVIHYAPPMSIEAYFQEAGRVGRDGKKSYAVMLFTPQDIKQLAERINNKYPPIETIKRVYQALANYYQIAAGSFPQESFSFNISDFSSTYKLTIIETFNAMTLLEKSRLILMSESMMKLSKVRISVSTTDLYKTQVANQQYDVLTKALLRLYGGEIFTDFMEVREEEVAKLINITVKLVEHTLQNLDKLEVLQYEKRNSGTKVVFTQQRVSSDKINADSFLVLKEKDIQRLSAMENYITHEGCRAQVIANYFGEDLNACGKCDKCLEKRKNIDENQLKEKIISILSSTEFIPINKLMAQFITIEKDVCFMILREMIDQKEVILDSDNVKLK